MRPCLCFVVLLACGTTPSGSPAPAPTREVRSSPRPTLGPKPSSAEEPAPRVAARRIAMFGQRACAVLVDGGVACWGGMRGSVPHRIPGIDDAVEVAVVDEETFITRKSGAVAIGGTNVWGFDTFDDATAITGEYSARCVLRRSGVVLCAHPRERLPRAVRGVHGATAIAVGRAHGCVIVDQGRVWCWDHPMGRSAMATQIPSLEGAIDISMGAVIGCVRRKDRTVSCFPLAGSARKPWAVGSADAIAVTDVYDGTPAPILCRADGAEAECLFVDETKQTTSPGRLRARSKAPVVQLAATYDGFCMLDTAGEVRCLGGNSSGVLGTPSSRWIEAPARMKAPALRAIGAGNGFVCGLTTSNQVWCAQREAPAQTIGGLGKVARFIAQNGYACAFAPKGQATCFFVSKDGIRHPHRVPPLDGARDVVLPGLGHVQPVAIVTASGGLALGETANFDSMKGLALTTVSGTGRFERVALQAQTYDPKAGGLVSKARALDASGQVWEQRLLDNVPTVALKRIGELDGAVALTDGFALKRGGELWKRDEDRWQLARAKSPLVSLFGDGACGPSARGDLVCLDVHPAVPAAPDDRQLFEAMHAVFEYDRHYYAIDKKGALYCRGNNEHRLCGPSAGIDASTTPRLVPLR